MSIKTYLKVVLFGIISMVMLNIIAMDWDLVETRIISILDQRQPIDYQQIDRLSKDLKLISKPRPKKAEDFLKQAYTMLVSENKFELAKKLLISLEDIPQLKNRIEQLELDLTNKISVQQFKEEPKVQAYRLLKPDPVLEPIIKEHSTDKSDIENSRIEFTITGGKLIPLLNFPTFTTIKQESIIIGIQQMPVLSQRQYYGIRPGIIAKIPIVALPSNYCGYYAAYNLWCIITKQPNEFMNRKLFAEHFGAMLSIIKRNDLDKMENEGFSIKPAIHKNPYDDLAGYETEYLLKKEFNIDPAQYLALGIAKGNISSASENINAFDKRAKLLETFRSGPFEQMKTISILFNVEKSHWIAIKAMRKNNALTFEIFDSSGTRNWQDTYETKPINTDILKSLGIYLTTPGMT